MSKIQELYESRVGKYAEITAAQDGVLELRMNVSDKNRFTQDGELSVTISSD